MRREEYMRLASSEAVEIFQVALDGVGNVSVAAALGRRGLHGIGGSGEGDGKIVKIFLKFAKTCEAEHANDANDGSGIGTQTLGHGANTEQHEAARMFEYRTQNFLPLGGESGDTFLQIYSLRRCRGSFLLHG